MCAGVFVWVYALCVGVHTKARIGYGVPGTGVTVGCMLPNVGAGAPDIGLLEEQRVLFS